MRRNLLKILCILIAVLMAGTICSVAQENSLVRIVFDKDAERADIVTGDILPKQALAQRGSFLFYNDRLDNPSEHFWYFFDGKRRQIVTDMVFMRHMKSIGTWIVFNKQQRDDPLSGHPKWHCEIGHHAVSFIPVNASGNPGKRVHVLLNDIHLIQWEKSDLWLTTSSQEEIEAKAGTIY